MAGSNWVGHRCDDLISSIRQQSVRGRGQRRDPFQQNFKFPVLNNSVSYVIIFCISTAGFYFVHFKNQACKFKLKVDVGVRWPQVTATYSTSPTYKHG